MSKLNIYLNFIIYEAVSSEFTNISMFSSVFKAVTSNTSFPGAFFVKTILHLIVVSVNLIIKHTLSKKLNVYATKQPERASGCDLMRRKIPTLL